MLDHGKDKFFTFFKSICPAGSCQRVSEPAIQKLTFIQKSKAKLSKINQIQNIFQIYFQETE
jgi:hypothetical protein